jgi:N6-adenosine-specific RNA methylase IME4/ParB-like chromosome segregation protein Spo0J
MSEDIKLSDIQIGANRRAVNMEKVSQLAESIKEVGLINPVLLSQENVLVAGNHRLEAFKLLGYEAIPFRYVEKNDLLRLRLAEIHENLMRNNGTQLEQSEWLAESKQIYEQLYPETKAGVAGGLARQNSANEKTSFAETTAQTTGLTPRSIQVKVKRANDIPQDIRDMIRGTDIADSGKELDAIVKVSKQEPEKAKQIVQSAIEKNVPIEQAVRELKREEVRQERVERVIQLAETAPKLETVNVRYPVIYADPPWQYEHSKADNRAIENHYPTMTLGDICAMPISELAAPDAVLFLWVTSPKLVEGLRVIESWGFNYVTSAVWIKDKIGMGYYFRQRHELLFVAKRGDIPVSDPSNRIDSVLQFPRMEHSAKPHEVYEIIERMYPEYRKIELFARNTKEGWEGWGNQYGKSA